MIDYIEGFKEEDFEKVLSLYESVNWKNYTDNPDSLKKALENSTYVILAKSNEEVLGLARSISDDSSIHYLQDILINTNHQRKGIGRALFEKVLERFSHVKTHMLLTDDEKKQIEFYKSLGFSNTRELEKFKLNAFVKMKGVELS